MKVSFVIEMNQMIVVPTNVITKNKLLSSLTKHIIYTYK